MQAKHVFAGLFLTGFAAAAVTLPAAAAPVITQVAPGSFTLLNLGVGTADARQATTSPITVNTGGIATITFSGGVSTGDPNQASGVYAGNQPSIAVSPLGFGDSTTNYLVAQPDPDLAKNVQVNYAAARTILDILWGTIDSSLGYNLITTSAGETITGAQILAVVGGSTGGPNAWLRITGLAPFTWIEATDSNSKPSAFEFLPGTVPEPASLALLGTALFGYGVLRRRKQS